MKFKHYPPSWIPLKYWVSRVGWNGKTEYLVFPTLWAFIRKESQIN